MAIYIDPPLEYCVPGLMRGRPFTSSHMISDKTGVEGEQELITFGAKIGQKRAWLQKPGTPYVHFDVMNSRYAVAVRAGAIEISSKEMARMWIKKREALNPSHLLPL